MKSLVFAQLAAILLVSGLRFGPSDPWLLPLPLGAGVWGACTALALLLAAYHLARDIRAGRAPWADSGRALLWIVFVVVGVLHWSFGSLDFETGVEIPVFALVGGLVLGFLWNRRRDWWRADLSGTGWAVAARWVLGPTVLGVGLLAILGPRWGDVPGNLGQELSLALSTYPLYATLQLVAMLVLPALQWRRDGESPRDIIIGCTCVFALVHWPNPFALVATIVGMAVWSSAWVRGSALIPLAISMGLLAAVATQRVPLSITGHMRVGPGYVLRQAQRVETEQREQLATRLGAEEQWQADGSNTSTWLRTVHSELFGVAADSSLISIWSKQLERLHRQQAIRYFYVSDEFSKRERITTELSDDEMEFFDSSFMPFLPQQAGYDLLGSESFFEACGASYSNWLSAVYLELLKRPLHEGEARFWPLPLRQDVREELVRRLVARQLETEPMRRLPIGELSLKRFDSLRP